MSLPSIFDYLPGAAPSLFKMAEEQPKKQEGMLAPVLKGTLAYGAGVGLGGAAGYLADKAYTKYTGQDLHARYLLPLASAVSLGGKYLYDRWKSEELKRLQDAYKAKRNKPEGKPSG